jgi:hypothetical protein
MRDEWGAFFRDEDFLDSFTNIKLLTISVQVSFLHSGKTRLSEKHHQKNDISLLIVIERLGPARLDSAANVPRLVD